jgi:biopolymer transport protein ExbD
MDKIPRPEEPFSLTPMIDVSFLLIVFFILLPMKTLDQKITAFLPLPDGIRQTMLPPKETVKIRVRQEGDAFLYALGQNVAPEAKGLAPVVRALGPRYAYEIDATSAVPWQRVVDAVNMLVANDCTEVRFRGGKLPPRYR